MKKVIITASILLFSGYAFAEGLDTLIEVGRGQAEIAREARDETRNFEAVKQAVENESIQKGQSKDRIRDRYGVPVIEFPKDKNRDETWIYKPGKASFFDGPKIYLIFGDDGILSGIKVVEEKEEKKVREEKVEDKEKDGKKKKNEMSVLRKPKRQRNRF